MSLWPFKILAINTTITPFLIVVKYSYGFFSTTKFVSRLLFGFFNPLIHLYDSAKLNRIGFNVEILVFQQAFGFDIACQVNQLLVESALNRARVLNGLNQLGALFESLCSVNGSILIPSKQEYGTGHHQQANNDPKNGALHP